MPPCETDEQERLFGSREADLGRVSMKLRWSLGERRIEKGYLFMVWSWIFIDTSVNFDVYHRLIGRRLGVHSSFTSGVMWGRRLRACQAQRQGRPAEQSSSKGHGRRRTVLLVCNKVTSNDRTVVSSRLLQMIELSANQKTNKSDIVWKKLGWDVVTLAYPMWLLRHD